MSALRDGVMITEGPNRVRVRRQKTSAGVGENWEGVLVSTSQEILLATVTDALKDAGAEVGRKLETFKFVPGDRVRVTLLVEVVK